MEQTVRLQFDFTGEQTVKMEALMEQVGVRTKKAFFNHALSLLEWAINEKKAGRMVVSIDKEKDKYTELILPFFV